LFENNIFKHALFENRHLTENQSGLKV